MRYWAVSVLLITLMSPWAGWAQAGCGFRPLPLVRVQINERPLKIDHQFSAAALYAMPNNTQVRMTGKDHIGGLTQSEINANVTLSFDSETTFLAGNGCLWVTTLTVQMSLSPVVFIASDWPEGDCRYQAMLEHEMKHVETDRAVLKEFQSRMTNNFRSMIQPVAAQGPMASSSMYQAQENLVARVNQRLQSEMADLQQERDRRQQAIDTPEEYRALGARCR